MESYNVTFCVWLLSLSINFSRFSLSFYIYIYIDTQFIYFIFGCAGSGFSLVVVSGGYSLVEVHGAILFAEASLVAEHRLSTCGARASLLHSMWDLPGPGIEPVSPALAGRFLTTEPPGKPQPCYSMNQYFIPYG